MSLDQVSEQTGVSKSMLAQIERGTANPSLVCWEDYKWSEDRVSGADTAAESGLLSGDTGRTGSYQGDSRTVQGMDLSAL